jgi:hypothetical protein
MARLVFRRATDGEAQEVLATAFPHVRRDREPITNSADQVNRLASVFESECSGCGKLVAWRNRLELAVRYLEEQPHAGGENFAGPLADLDPLAGIGRKPDSGRGDSSQPRLQDLVELLGSGTEHEIAFFESRGSD